MFHRIPHPDPTIRHSLGMPWTFAVFKRAYEVETGEVLGETLVYDPTVAFDFMDWGDAERQGHRIILANGFPMVDTHRCSDRETLSKLSIFYDERRKRKQAIQKAWLEEHQRAQLPDQGNISEYMK